MIYLLRLSARRSEEKGRTFLVVEASTEREALQRGEVVADALYPLTQGWTMHLVKLLRSSGSANGIIRKKLHRLLYV